MRDTMNKHRLTSLTSLSLPLLLALVLALSACDALPGFTGRSQPATATPQAAAEQASTEKLPYDEKADPHKDVAAAFAQAKQDSKYVLLDFGANWCLDCRVLAK